MKAVKIVTIDAVDVVRPNLSIQSLDGRTLPESGMWSAVGSSCREEPMKVCGRFQKIVINQEDSDEQWAAIDGHIMLDLYKVPSKSDKIFHYISTFETISRI